MFCIFLEHLFLRTTLHGCFWKVSIKDAWQSCKCSTNIECLTQRKMSPYLELLWSVFSHIWFENEKIRSFSPYSVQMGEKQTRKTPNTDTFHILSSIVFKFLSTSWISFFVWKLNHKHLEESFWEYFHFFWTRFNEK